MEFDIDNVVSEMIAALTQSLGNSWAKVSDYAETESLKLAQSAADLAKLHLAGKIGVDQSKLMLTLQANTAKLVFLAIEGMGIIAVEEAINAALSILREAVNTAAGIVIF